MTNSHIGTMERPKHVPSLFVYLPYPVGPYYAETPISREILEQARTDAALAKMLIEDLMSALSEFEAKHGL